jgi:hypothetical protein
VAVRKTGLAGARAMIRFIQALLFATRPNHIAVLIGICGLINAPQISNFGEQVNGSLDGAEA